MATPSACIADASSVDPDPLESTPLATLDQLRAQGYLIVERLAPLATIQRINEELDPWFAATPRCEGDFYGHRTTRLNSILLKSRRSHELLLHTRITALMCEILGPHCESYQLNLSQAIRLHPGERQQVPHRDDEMWPSPKHGAEYLVNVLWALSEFTDENGATRIWPRSQHRVMPRGADARDAIPASMPAGSALIYLGSVTHCGGANRSTEPRTGLVFSYSLGWLRPYENSSLAYPPEIARTFPTAVRDLIGYRLHRPNLGHYEGRDPSVALEPHSRTMAMTDALPPAIAEELRQYYAAHAE
ncbi:phytanoyl-CoA dioxygenase family protein [Povalibacter sp.]|uniref:phytanoyl-CoA dioxygenase family protein n=1 Tax=Povalibacter sp. TaxID=1962978 RepID=UPI002F410D5E